MGAGCGAVCCPLSVIHDGLLFQAQLLLSGFFLNRGNQTENIRIPFLLFDCGVVKFSHSLKHLTFPYIMEENKGKST